MNFLLSIAVLIGSIFLLAVSIRYGLAGVGKLDDYFSIKRNSSYPGFNRYYRLPGSAGFVLEYYFLLVIGRDNYFKTNWWALKTSAILSILVTIATINGRSTVYNYFSLELIRNGGIGALFTSGFFVWYLNIIMLLYLVLAVLVIIESIKMHGFYAPVRILAYGILSFLMADLTIIIIGLLVAIMLLYLLIKIIWFFFFSSSRRRRKAQDEEETTTGILKQGIGEFKQEVLAWEEELKSNRIIRNEQKEKVKPKVKIRRKKPKIKRKTYKNDIPRLHPD